MWKAEKIFRNWISIKHRVGITYWNHLIQPHFVVIHSVDVKCSNISRNQNLRPNYWNWSYHNFFRSFIFTDTLEESQVLAIQKQLWYLRDTCIPNLFAKPPYVVTDPHFSNPSKYDLTLYNLMMYMISNWSEFQAPDGRTHNSHCFEIYSLSYP